MDALANKIDREREELAADFSAASGKILVPALELIDDFDRRVMS
ncbi:hypothetical protein [Rhizobium leucaenae]|uniref:Uncharacterized protein n=1 Tax=Rhizobium leucaenae TaxID=29450 RepID=A0A7W7A089_9HYPH|nr:hypothetical protein [Rhizobium leucaenae]MBB4571390.1 hypothetical protein [Rhizobium leucaenae]